MLLHKIHSCIASLSHAGSMGRRVIVLFRAAVIGRRVIVLFGAAVIVVKS